MRAIWSGENFIIYEEAYRRMIIYEKMKIGKVLKDLRKKSRLTQLELRGLERLVSGKKFDDPDEDDE